MEIDKRLVGAWRGLNRHGHEVILVFGADGEFEEKNSKLDLSFPNGSRFKFTTNTEVEPAKIYQEFLLDNELLERWAYAIYKFDDGDLVLSDAKDVSHEGVSNITEFNTEFPGRFEADNYVLRKELDDNMS